MKCIRTVILFLLFPLALGAMTPVPDSELSEVNCQAGVSINPDVTMNIHIGTIAWGDSDGINPSCGVNPWPDDAGAGGYVAMTDFDVTGLRIKLRDSDNYGGYNSATMMKPMTIDVATGYKPYSGFGNDTTYVRIAPGALKISMESMHFDIALASSPDALAQSGQVLGRASVGATEAYVNPSSYVDTYAHGKSGVAFDVHVVLDGMKSQYVSWGNTR
jgi:hypothetical protein